MSILGVSLFLGSLSSTNNDDICTAPGLSNQLRDLASCDKAHSGCKQPGAGSPSLRWAIRFDYFKNSILDQTG